MTPTLATVGGRELLHWLGPCVLVVGATFLAIPLVRRIAIANELYDRPDAGLKPHQKPIPYLGGLAIWFGWLIGLLALMAVAGLPHWTVAWIAVAGSALMFAGLIDDLRRIPPVLRLLIQIAAAVLLIWAGIGRDVWPALAEPYLDRLPDMCSDECTEIFFSGIICVFILTGATNATNLIDGLDGLCAGMLGIAALGLWMSGLLLWSVHGQEGQVMLQGALCVAVAGACAAFLCYNFSPASIFMGDSGSLLLGFNVALLILFLIEQGAWRGLVVGVIVFGFPIFDTALAIARRALNGRPLFVGDRSHFYDQLCDRGLSVRATVVICYAIGILFALLGCTTVLLSPTWITVIAIAAPILAALACWRLGLLRVDNAAERSKTN